mmetsp:Transcript_22409/g.68270  ORF Transcript_22409/g.68270 Transcript_22409/m.68270 type:complete len:179 (-) Transcript_22409:882-1418(-)
MSCRIRTAMSSTQSSSLTDSSLPPDAEWTWPPIGPFAATLAWTMLRVTRAALALRRATCPIACTSRASAPIANLKTSRLHLAEGKQLSSYFTFVRTDHLVRLPGRDLEKRKICLAELLAILVCPKHRARCGDASRHAAGDTESRPETSCGSRRHAPLQEAESKSNQPHTDLSLIQLKA